MNRIFNFFKAVYQILFAFVVDFARNQDSLKAAALSFYTFTSIVPFLAIVFGIASGFGFEDFLAQQLHEAFPTQDEIIAYVIHFAKSLLQNTKNSVIAGVGFVILLYAAFSILGTVEDALNEILKVGKGRSWGRKITDYLALMIILPIMFIATSTFNVFLVTQIHHSSEQIYWLKLVSPFLLGAISAVPFLLSILLFITIYVFIPNTWVRLSSRIAAGIITGIIFQIWQWAYIRFQGEISNYGAVYGTFAALPLFLLWLQISWLIVLIGAEIAAFLENRITLPVNVEQMPDGTPKYVGLMIVYLCVKAYHNGENPPTLVQISQTLGISPMYAKQVITLLEEGRILIETRLQANGEIGCLPGKDTHLLSVKSICDEIEKRISWTTPLILSPALKKISEILHSLDNELEHSQANVTMKDLIQMDLG